MKRIEQSILVESHERTFHAFQMKKKVCSFVRNLKNAKDFL